MSFDDFEAQFDNIDFVHLNLNAFQTEKSVQTQDVKWKFQQFYGAWVPGKTGL
jgi:hypothetical protein